MKKKIFVGFAFGLTIAASVATIVADYDRKKPPALPLPQAYDAAITALGPAAKQYHCLRATAEDKIFSKDGEWFFTFYTTNGKPKWVTVEFSGKIHIEDVMVR